MTTTAADKPARARARLTRPAPDQAAAAQAAADTAQEPLAGEVEARVVQGGAEGVVHGPSVEFMGRRFRIADKVGLMPLMKFASASDAQLDTTDFRALAAMYEMLRDCIAGEIPPCGQCPECKAGAGPAEPPGTCPYYDQGDWYRFEQHAIRTKADADDLFPVVQQTIEILTARPTRQP